MDLAIIDKIEAVEYDKLEIDVIEKMKAINNKIPKSLDAVDGIYGTTQLDKGNGCVVKFSKNELGYRTAAYYQANLLYKVSEKIADNVVQTTSFDKDGVPYLIETRTKDGLTVIKHTRKYIPNTTFTLDNITHKVDEAGRIVYSEMKDIQIVPGRASGNQNLRDKSYLEGDQISHLIPDIFDGPTTRENTCAQTQVVNQSLVKKVEGLARRFKAEGHRVDYAVKKNFDSPTADRASSFEIKILVDGEQFEFEGEYADLKKIYNNNLSEMEKKATDIKEIVNDVATKTKSMREVGRIEGIEAAAITCAISTVENIQSYVSGEVTVDEAIVNIAKETGAAGAIGYASGFATMGIAKAMEASSKELISSLAGSGVPAAVVAFGVTSYESVIDYATGETDLNELAYDLGSNAVNVAGSSVGSYVGASVGTLVAPGLGTAAGAMVGGMVGCAVSSAAYKTAIEMGCKEAGILAEEASKNAKYTVELAEKYVPDKVDEIKLSIQEFAQVNGVTISV